VVRPGRVEHPTDTEECGEAEKASCRDRMDREAAEEACGKVKFGCNGVLTFWWGLLILVSSLEATLLDRGVEQTLFDNLIDVPESVRTHSSLRA